MGLTPENLIKKEKEEFSRRLAEAEDIPFSLRKKLTDERVRWWLPQTDQWDTPYGIWTSICMEDLDKSSDACEEIWDENRETLESLLEKEIEGWATPWYTKEELKDLRERAERRVEMTPVYGIHIPGEREFLRKVENIPPGIEEEIKPYEGNWEEIRDDLRLKKKDRLAKRERELNRKIEETEDLTVAEELERTKEDILDTEKALWDTVWDHIDRVASRGTISAILTYPDLYKAFTSYWEDMDDIYEEAQEGEGLSTTFHIKDLRERTAQTSRKYKEENFTHIVEDLKDSLIRQRTKKNNLDEIRKKRHWSEKFADWNTDLYILDGVTRDGLTGIIEEDTLEDIEKDIQDASYAVHGRRRHPTTGKPKLYTEAGCNMRNATSHTNNLFRIRSMDIQDKLRQAEQLEEQKRTELVRDTDLPKADRDYKVNEYIKDQTGLSLRELEKLEDIYDNIADIGREMSTRADKECRCKKRDKYKTATLETGRLFEDVGLILDEDYISAALAADLQMTSTDEELDALSDRIDSKIETVDEMIEDLEEKRDNINEKDYSIEDIKELENVDPRVKRSVAQFVKKRMDKKPTDQTKVEDAEWREMIQGETEKKYRRDWVRRIMDNLDTLQEAKSELKSLISDIKNIGTGKGEGEKWEVVYSEIERGGMTLQNPILKRKEAPADIEAPGWKKPEEREENLDSFLDEYIESMNSALTMAEMKPLSEGEAETARESLREYWESDEAPPVPDTIDMLTEKDFEKAIDMANRKVEYYSREGDTEKSEDWLMFRNDINNVIKELDDLQEDVRGISRSIYSCSAKDFIDYTDSVAEFCGDTVSEYDGQLDKADIDANDMCRQADRTLDKSRKMFDRLCKCKFKGIQREAERIGERETEAGKEVGIELNI